MSLTMVSFETASLFEYACHIRSLYLLKFKVMAKVNIFPDKHTQTGQQLDAAEIYFQAKKEINTGIISTDLASTSL